MKKLYVLLLFGVVFVSGASANLVPPKVLEAQERLPEAQRALERAKNDLNQAEANAWTHNTQVWQQAWTWANNEYNKLEQLARRMIRQESRIQEAKVRVNDARERFLNYFGTICLYYITGEIL